jgi:hypothetical protein
MSLDYPDRDFPWTFYFNGVAMPKWAAQWPPVPSNSSDWDKNVGPRDLYIIRCKIDHIGKIESANPHIFLYAVQEILCLLVTEHEAVMQHYERNAQHWSVHPEEIFNGVLEGAFQMRERVRKDGHAFWTSGYEADCFSLVQAIRRANLPPKHPEFEAPPHVRDQQRLLKMYWDSQIRTLHRAATQEGVSKALRKRLLEL